MLTFLSIMEFSNVHVSEYKPLRKLTVLDNQNDSEDNTFASNGDTKSENHLNDTV